MNICDYVQIRLKVACPPVYNVTLNQRSSLLVLESRRVCWGPHSWSRRAVGCAGVFIPGPGKRQGVLGSSFLVLESCRVCWCPHSWSWRDAGCAGVLTPGPGETQGVLGSSLLVLESCGVCWGLHSWTGEPQGVLGSSLLVLESCRVCWGPHLLVLESRRMCWGPHSWSWRAAGCAGVLTPGPGEPQGVLGSPGPGDPQGCAGVLTPGPGEPQGVLGSSLLVLGELPHFCAGFCCYSALNCSIKVVLYTVNSPHLVWIGGLTGALLSWWRRRSTEC